MNKQRAVFKGLHPLLTSQKVNEVSIAEYKCLIKCSTIQPRCSLENHDSDQKGINLLHSSSFMSSTQNSFMRLQLIRKNSLIQLTKMFDE